MKTLTRFFRPSFRVLSLLLGVAAAGALGGCSILPEPKADPTRFFVLGDVARSAPSAPETTGDVRPAADALRIGLRTIEVASYLNNRAIVVRTADNEIAFREFERWAETPAASIGRVITESLNRSPRVQRLFVQPFPFDGERDYDVSVRVTRFEGAKLAGGAAGVRFACEIEVTEPSKGSSGAVVLRRTLAGPEIAWDGRDFGALAKGLGLAVAAVGDELATLLPARAAK